ncbi:MAG: hypothetical protein JW719_02250 [Pirellulales bacterium]|nr:hypothetical protein [Pirellulales bacterium]
MKDKPCPRPTILEAIELSGRGRENASDCARADLAAPLDGRPELVELRDSSRRADEALRKAVLDLPVPYELGQRILDRLALSSVDPADELAPDAGEPRPARPPGASKNAHSRRRWIAAAAVAATVAVVAVGLTVFWQPKPYSTAQIIDAAVERFIAGQMPPGNPLSENVLASHPLSREIRRLPSTRWRKIDNFLGHKAVAYEMSTAGGARATLFVMPCRRSIPSLAASPPSRPRQATGGKATAAWQSDGMVYVLVVAGNDRTYRMFLDLGRPLA